MLRIKEELEEIIKKIDALMLYEADTKAIEENTSDTKPPTSKKATQRSEKQVEAYKKNFQNRWAEKKDVVVATIYDDIC